MADGSIWDAVAVGSNPAIPTVTVADLVMHRIVAPDYAGSTPVGHLSIIEMSQVQSLD